jgi:hypothetical protein
MSRRHLVIATCVSMFLLSGCTDSDPTGPNGKISFARKGGGKNKPRPLADTPTPITIYGAWHCSDDSCLWGTERTVAEFDSKNAWLINGNGGGPAVNLVVLSFVNPLRLLNKTTDAYTENGVPRGMTPEIVDYFKSRGVRVELSIGGITYVDDWNSALASDAWQLGLNAAEVAQRLGVGIEIDYEENSGPDLGGLQDFIDAYRSVLPYDPTGGNHARRLTIDLAAGDRWLIDLTRHATIYWLDDADPVLDHANAMVPNRQPGSASDAITNWREHVDGKSRFDPPIPPLAPQMFTGSLYIVTGRKTAPECDDYWNSLQMGTRDFVERVMPNGAGSTPGMLGLMFWAAERPSPRRISTAPPNSCEGGVGVGAADYAIPIPMPALRQTLIASN